MFELDEETEERIDFICQMDLIGRSIADAVEHNIASPMLRRSTLNKEIPVVALRRLLLCPHLRSGNIPALFAELTKEYLLIRDTPHVRLYVLNMFRMRGSRL